MKRIFTFSLLTMALFFTQCKKSEQTSDADAPFIEAKVEGTTENNLAVESFKSLPSQDLKRVAFAALTPVERYLLWINNIKTVSKKFTPSQQAVAFELAVLLKPSLFSANENDALKTMFDNWLKKAAKALSPTQIRALAYQIGDSDNHKAINSTGLKTNGDDVGNIKCDCNKGSAFTCDPIDTSIYCQTDMVGFCTSANVGCGTFYAFACNSMCRKAFTD